ncbi:MAG: PAS domain S-box protein [Holophagaceae bacterium]|nr:PAS domain S-box protein [Holophagaceae bacterium]
MVQFNTRANEILLKLVYYGPGLSGKTTNLQTLHALCQDQQRGEMFSVNTQEDRTLFFDLLPINLGYIYGNSIHLQIYTVPGQVQYDASRRVVLGGADGVVFVADSSESKMQDNVDSLSNLYHNLNANRLNIKQIPFVLQYNKRDLPDAMPVGVMNRRLNFRNVPYFEAVANRGPGVMETFLAITRETVSITFKKYHLDKKIKDFDEMLNLIETNIRANMRELPTPPDTLGQPESTVMRHSDVSVADLAPGKVVDASDLLEDALKSNMETARLYSELKQTKSTLEQKNAEMNQLYSQLERANQDNLKTRRYLEGIIQGVGEAIISFGSDGKILTWNMAAEKMFGYARADIVGQTMQSLTPASKNWEIAQAVTLVGQGQPLRSMQTTRLRKGGVEFPVSISYAPVLGADDRVLAFSALVKDLGEQKELEKKLVDSQGQTGMGRILPIMLDALQARINPILVQSRLLQESAMDPAQATQAQKIIHAVDSMQALMRPINLVLNPPSMKLEATQLNRLVLEAQKRVESEAAAAGVAIDVSLDPTAPDSLLDFDQMREAIVGLLRNAIYSAAKAPKKRTRVATRRVGEAMQLAVQDSGPLYSEAAQASAFELSSIQDLDSIGLAVASAVIRQHGGRIALRSQEGSGNTVMAEIPLGTAADQPVPAEPAE